MIHVPFFYNNFEDIRYSSSFQPSYFVTTALSMITISQVASRSLKNQVEPIITMKLHTQHHDQVTSTLLQTDPVNLIHLTQQLEEALNEAKSQHTRRIERNIK